MVPRDRHRQIVELLAWTRRPMMGESPRQRMRLLTRTYTRAERACHAAGLDPLSTRLDGMG
jgi:hypothetical protein